MGVNGSHLNSIGIADSSATLNTFLGFDLHGWGYLCATGNNNGIYHNNAEISPSHMAGYGDNTVIAFALDMDNGALYTGIVTKGDTIWDNNSSNVTGIPSSGSTKTGAILTGLSGPMFAACGDANSTCTANFGATPFSGVVPAGYNHGLYS